MKAILIFLFAATCSFLPAADFCAVTVNVSMPSATQDTTPVTLRDALNRIVGQTTLSPQGTAQFCDFGFGEHTIQIGDKCGYVTLHGIRFIYGVPQFFEVVLNRCTLGIGGDGGRYPPSCLLYLRVASATGTAVPFAIATSKGEKMGLSADRYGRLILFPRNGTSASYSVSAPGFSPAVVSADCKAYETIEREVRLNPAP